MSPETRKVLRWLVIFAISLPAVSPNGTFSCGFFGITKAVCLVFALPFTLYALIRLTVWLIGSYDEK